MSGTNGLDFEYPLRELEKKIQELEEFSSTKGVDLAEQIQGLQQRWDELAREIFASLSPWQRVMVARHPNRPVTSDYLQLMETGFIELHGDRSFRDDQAIISGLGRCGSQKVMYIGHQKGKNTRERMACNWGSPHPEGYRKALLKMKLAEKFSLPIICLIDTPGAYPGIGAEERGQAQAISLNLFEMSTIRVPIVCVVIGEGGSGGALGLGVGDRLSVLQNSYYSVISPEGCAAILWKSADKKEDAARALKLDANELLRQGVIDEVIQEPLGGAHRRPKEMAATLKETLMRHLAELEDTPPETLIEERYEKFRHMGVVIESP